MSALMEYSFKGEWTDVLQAKLKQWFESQKDFLVEMDFEANLFEDFITVMVKEKRRTMGEIEKELQELQIDEPRAIELCESLAKVLKSAESSMNPLLSRALQTGRGPAPRSSEPSAQPSGRLNTALKTSREVEVNKKEGAPGQSSVRLFNAALQNTRGGDGRQHGKPDQRTHGKRRDDSHLDQSEESSKKYRRGSAESIAPPPPNSPPPGPGSSEAETIKYFERMNELAQKSGFKNAQEMLASQQQMMAMMHGAAPIPPAAAPHHFGHMPPIPPGPMMPHVEPQRFDYFPQQHFQPYAGYEPYGGFHTDPRFHGHQGRGGRGAGRGRGRFGNKEFHAQPKPSAEVGSAESAPKPEAPAEPAPPSQPAQTAPQQENTQPITPRQNAPFGGRGGGRESSFSGRFAGGRTPFGGRGTQAPFVAASNPFARSAESSQQPAASTLPTNGPFGAPSAPFGQGFGGRFAGAGAGRGRGRDSAAAAGHKVWVRKTEGQ